MRGDPREVYRANIFSMAVPGLGTEEITRRLNQQGITRGGGKPWESVYVRNILIMGVEAMYLLRDLPRGGFGPVESF